MAVLDEAGIKAMTDQTDDPPKSESAKPESSPQSTSRPERDQAAAGTPAAKEPAAGKPADKPKETATVKPTDGKPAESPDNKPPVPKLPPVDLTEENKRLRSRINGLQSKMDKTIAELTSKIEELGKPKSPDRPLTEDERKNQESLEKNKQRILQDPAAKAAIEEIARTLYGNDIEEFRQYKQALSRDRQTSHETLVKAGQEAVITALKDDYPGVDLYSLIQSDQYLDWYVQQPPWVHAAASGPRPDGKGGMIPGGGMEGAKLVLNRYFNHIAEHGAAPSGGNNNGATPPQETEEQKQHRELTEAAGIRQGGTPSAQGAGNKTSKDKKLEVLLMDDDKFRTIMNAERF